MNRASGLKPYIERLGSMPLAIVLLMVLAIASIIGTVLIQNQQQGDYLGQFGPLWYWTFHALGLFDMYHTWWFLTLLGFLMLSLGVCLWRNTPRMFKDMKNRKVIIADKSLQRFHHLRHLEIKNCDAESVRTEFERQLTGWEFALAEDGGRSYVRADKGRKHKWGYILVHSAILVILTGGWLSVQFGFRGNMAVVEGKSEKSINFLKGTSVKKLEMPFAVRCNDFTIDFFPTGQPKEFRSNLTIIDGGKEVLTKDIIVNEPLYYKGVNIYQASFGDGGSAIRLKLFRLDGSERVDTKRTHVYKTYKDEATGVSLEITDFKPFNVQNVAGEGEPTQFQDLGPAVEFILRGPGLKPVKLKSFMNPFVVNGQNRGMFMMASLSGEARDYMPISLGMDFSNPSEWKLYHAFARKLKGMPKTKDRQVYFQAFQAALTEVFGANRPKDFQLMGVRVLQSINMLGRLPWPFIPVLDDYEQVYYTGLQLTQDPGMNVVWIGSTILVIGLCIMFYMPHRKLWLVLEPKGKDVSLSLAGMTNRNRLGFEKEFHDLLSNLEQCYPLRDDDRRLA